MMPLSIAKEKVGVDDVLSHIKSRFGIELEIVVDEAWDWDEDIDLHPLMECRHCGGADEDCHACVGEGYTNIFINNWRIVREHVGFEFVSPVYHDIAPAMRDVSEIIREASQYHEGFDNNGLHIHVEAQNLSAAAVQEAIEIFAHCQEQIYEVFEVCPYREEQWAAMLTPDRVERAKRLAARFFEYPDRQFSGNRYFGINLYSLWAHGTIEFRLFNGYLDINYIQHAITCSRLIVELGSQVAENKLDRSTACRLLGIYLKNISSWG